MALGLGLIGLNAIASIFDFEGHLRSALRNNKYAERYTPEMQAEIYKNIKARFGTPLDAAEKKAIVDPVNDTVTSMKNYRDRRNAAIDNAVSSFNLTDAQLNQLKNLNDVVNKSLDLTLLRFEVDANSFCADVDDIGKLDPNKKLHHAEDLLSAPYLLRNDLNKKLQKQNDDAVQAMKDIINNATFVLPPGQDKTALKDAMEQALTGFHTKEKDEINDFMKKSMDSLHTAKQQQANTLLAIEHNEELFKLLAIAQRNKTNPGAPLELDDDGTSVTVRMRSVNMETFVEDLEDLNKKRAKNNQDPLTLKSSGGYDINVSRDANGKAVFSATIPMGLKFWFHFNPRDLTTDLMHTQIELAIANKMVGDGKSIRLTATHKDPKKAELIAIKNYMAAIDLGLDPDKDFSCRIGAGADKTAAEMEQLIAERGYGTDLSYVKEKALRNKPKRAETHKNVSDTAPQADLETMKANASPVARDHFQAKKDELTQAKQVELDKAKKELNDAEVAAGLAPTQ